MKMFSIRGKMVMSLNIDLGDLEGVWKCCKTSVTVEIGKLEKKNLKEKVDVS